MAFASAQLFSARLVIIIVDKLNVLALLSLHHGSVPKMLTLAAHHLAQFLGRERVGIALFERQRRRSPCNDAFDLQVACILFLDFDTSAEGMVTHDEICI